MAKRSTELLSFPLALAAAGSGGKVPAWVQLFPAGEFKPRDARDAWKLTDAAKVIAASQLPAPIDYDHGAERDPTSDLNSRAAGWIEELAAHGPAGEPGLWGRVEWTPEGSRAVASKEYRFISPSFLHDPRTREVKKLLRAGLTNTPALDLKALASIQQLEEGNQSVDELLTKLRAALNLPDNASADDVVQAITAMRNTSTALCAAAGVTALGETEVTAICARLKNPASDPDQQKQIDDLQKQVASLQATLTGSTATVEVEKAIAAGKLTPGQKSWAVDYASRDPKGFGEFVKGQPVILASGRLAPEGAVEGGLTRDERAICAALNLTEDQFRAEKTRQTKH